MAEKLSVEAFLGMQREAGESITAIIEPVANDDSRVKVTPYAPSGGCMCHAALTVLKTAIDSVTVTDESHFCCGERHTVVEVAFADRTLADVFKQLVAARSPHTVEMSSHRRYGEAPVQDFPAGSYGAEVGRQRGRQLSAQRGPRIGPPECFWNCLDEWTQCNEWARDESDRCWCTNYYRACMNSCDGRQRPFAYCPPAGPGWA